MPYSRNRQLNLNEFAFLGSIFDIFTFSRAEWTGKCRVLADNAVVDVLNQCLPVGRLVSEPKCRFRTIKLALAMRQRHLFARRSSECTRVSGATAT